jgi:hypothetical protein
MSDNKKPLKIEFAPGVFDNFEGTQQELDEIMSNIQNMFANMSPEELSANSRSVSLDDLEELDEETQQQILSALDDLDNEERARRLN